MSTSFRRKYLSLRKRVMGDGFGGMQMVMGLYREKSLNFSTYLVYVTCEGESHT